MRSRNCKACGTAIIWISTGAWKSMPCDVIPTYYIERKQSGEKRIVTPNGEVLACEYTDDPSKATGVGYIPHWATCPHADRFRKKKKKE